MGMIRTYTELMQLPDFALRFRYLKLHGTVGEDTFGHTRWMNQRFYSSPEWKKFRNDIILRDNGCDLACEGHDIMDELIYIHHLNPIVKEDIVYSTENLMNPEFVICTSFRTHNAIHYGKEMYMDDILIDRKPNDTCPWR